MYRFVGVCWGLVPLWEGCLNCMDATSQLLSQGLPPKGVFWSEGAKRLAGDAEQPFLPAGPSPQPQRGCSWDSGSKGLPGLLSPSCSAPGVAVGWGLRDRYPPGQGPACRFCGSLPVQLPEKGPAEASPQPCVHPMARESGAALGREQSALCLCKLKQGTETPRALCLQSFSRAQESHVQGFSPLVQGSEGCWSECMKEQEFVSRGFCTSTVAFPSPPQAPQVSAGMFRSRLAGQRDLSGPGEGLW